MCALAGSQHKEAKDALTAAAKAVRMSQNEKKNTEKDIQEEMDKIRRYFALPYEPSLYHFLGMRAGAHLLSPFRPDAYAFDSNMQHGEGDR